MSIKTMILSAVTAMMIALTGCKSVPTTDAMYTTSRAIGVSAALVCNQTKIDNASRNAIVEIMNDIDVSVPQTNQTFESAWTPIATAHINKLVENGKVTNDQAVLIKSAFTTAVKGLDYVVNIKYPKVREYNELIEATTHGFCGGFLAYFKPVDTVSATGKIDYDVEAYNYMMKISNK